MRLIFSPQARKGTRLGDAKLIDSVIKDGLWCVHSRHTHGHDR